MFRYVPSAANQDAPAALSEQTGQGHRASGPSEDPESSVVAPAVQGDFFAFSIYGAYEPVTSRAGVANWTNNVGMVG